MEILVVGWWVLASIALIPTVVSMKGGDFLSAVLWIVVSLVFSPLLTLIALAAVPNHREK